MYELSSVAGQREIIGSGGSQNVLGYRWYVRPCPDIGTGKCCHLQETESHWCAVPSWWGFAWPSGPSWCSWQTMLWCSMWWYSPQCTCKSLLVGSAADWLSTAFSRKRNVAVPFQWWRIYVRSRRGIQWYIPQKFKLASLFTASLLMNTELWLVFLFFLEVH